ncbi:hypothetical protein TM48_01442 [Mycobacterium shottsii]|uniref:Uncharacterized protein n=1 Tax=Mycobacterium shottsii TaxID=133549 RepID=A0A7I7LB42_9MYCO|nr:hypothetical protein [Mycobacterium shottsii]QYL27240.1 hypothetical protein TM48_01442 [Mycobacterium shottsii]BBX56958.1 hypothetical protein MSHO_23030 [Mycobacterium shottsii]
MTPVRVTHMLNTGYRAAELAPAVFGIESVNQDGTVGGVRSGASMARWNVSVDPIDAGHATLEATTEQITRAHEIADNARDVNDFIAAATRDSRNHPWGETPSG